MDPNETTALEVAAPQTPIRKRKDNALSARINLDDQESLVAGAQRLNDFIVQNKLSSNIKGKQYVKAEGWQFLYALAGLRPHVNRPVRRAESNVPGEITYEAECNLFDAEGNNVGYGFAVASNLEAAHNTYEEYAIASYAQTRAISKAGRNRFAFIMALAGYAPTPLEEMQGVAEANTGAEAFNAAASGVKTVPPPRSLSAPAPLTPPIAANNVAAPAPEPVITAPASQQVANPSAHALPTPPAPAPAKAAPAPAPTMAVNRQEEAISDAEVIEDTPVAPLPTPPEPITVSGIVEGLAAGETVATKPPRAPRKKAEPAPAPVAAPEPEAEPELQPYPDTLIDLMVSAAVQNGQEAFESIQERLPVYAISSEQLEVLRAKLKEAGFELTYQLPA